MSIAFAATWGIAAAATGGILVRPWRIPEAAWALTGAAALVLLGLLPPDAALAGIARGSDVYLFLTGMMLVAELARQEGLFDWLAAKAARLAKGSPTRLFDLLFGVGILVTVFLFVLPISNPANLVIYGDAMPPLAVWLPRYALPSVLAIAATYLTLRLTQRGALRQPVASRLPVPRLSPGGRLTAAGILAMGATLMIASALDRPLGLPTCLAGLLTTAIVLVTRRRSPWPVVRHVSWDVLALVAGLFMLVEALDRTGAITLIADLLHRLAAGSPSAAAWSAGLAVGLASNLVNNLPAGLVAGMAVQHAGAPAAMTGGVLIGIDLGPNLSVTGSLATLLWLGTLRRAGIQLGAWQFLKLGMVVMPPALILALAGLAWSG
jgi:arsenical pump membrane protein